MTFILHRGGREVTCEELAQVPTPAATRTWQPIPHADLVAGVKAALLSAGGTISRENHGLSADGAKYFGTLALGTGQANYRTVIGLRNSHDMTFPAGLACGANVFVCDNLSFSGEIKLARKHTAHIQRDLPRLITSAIGKLGSMQAAQDRRFTAYDAHVIDVAHCPAGSTPDQVSDGLIMQAYRAGVIASSNIGQVLQEWDHSALSAFRDSPRNLWRLFNAFTSVLTPRIATADLVRRTIALHGILDLYAGLTAQAA